MGKAEGEGFTAISTNIGTYNDENHGKLHDELTEIEGKHGQIKFTLLQELNRSDRKFNDQALPPFYNEQPTTNQHKNEDNELRGVGIFGSTGNEEIEARIQSNLDSLHNEFLIKVANSSYSTTSGRKKDTQVALIDCYGNHAKKAVSDIETELTLAAEFCKNNQVNNIVLIGDLNTEKVELEGFWELRHPDLYHKDKVGARKTYIDKILVNFNGVKIEEVRKSLESKSSTNKSLGHKVIVFSVNKVAPCYTVTSLNYGRFNQIYNERLTELKNIEFGWNKIETARQNDNTELAEELLESAGTKLYQFLSEITNKATTTKTTRANMKHAYLKKAEEALDKNLTNQKKSKNFFTLCKNIKNGLERANSNLPELKEFTDKLETKLAALKTISQDLYDSLTNECYPQMNTSPEVISSRLKFPEKPEFDRIMRSVKKSGATDYKGLTTKATSSLFDKCSVFRAIIYKFFKAIFATGHVPKALKYDKICFLWKRKGSIMDPSAYRPITHAP